MARKSFMRRSVASRAFSLLEVVLALAISSVILGLLAMATHFHMRAFAERRDRVEQAQTARAILRQISDDLRSAVAFRPIDLEGVQAVGGDLGALMGAASGTPTTAGSTTSPPNSATGNSGSTASDASSSGGVVASSNQTEGDTGEITSGGSYQAGLQGDQFQIRFEMTRLPRLDEYQSIVGQTATTSVARIPTDIRTVFYAFAIPDAAYAADGGMEIAAGGLFRGERDRAVEASATALDPTGEQTDDDAVKLLAEEVTRLEFAYFDGYEWSTEWDSDLRGGLPLCVEILLGIKQPSSGADVGEEAEELLFRQVVRIPTAEPLEPLLEGEMTEDEASAGATP